MTKKIDVDWGLCESNGVCMGIIRRCSGSRMTTH